jgi:uncharacterized protein (TIRG00374 family)
VRQLPHAALVIGTFIFVIWCALSLRGDLARLSLEPVLQSWDLLALAAVLSLLNYVLRILRWRTYLSLMGYPLKPVFTALSYLAGFAYTLSPGKVGEMVRARYYVPLRVPLSAVGGAFFVERLLDLMVMVVLAMLVLTALGQYAGVMAIAAIIVTGMLMSVALMPWNRVATRLESSPRRLRGLLLGFTSALASTKPLLRPGVLAGGFVVGLLAWGLEGVGLGLLSSIYPSIHLDMVTAIGIYGVAVLIGGISFLPGGLGSTEAVMAALLVGRGYSVSQALLVTLACRLVTLWFAVCLGWVAVMVLRQRSMTTVTPWQ